MDWGRIAKRIRVPLGFAFAAFFLWRARPEWWSIALGFVVACIGLWIRALASGHVKKNEELATTGPYAYTRNPLYLGSVIIACGFVISALRWEIAVLFAVLFLVIYIPVIRGEENYLRGRFPQYDEYCARVPRLFPRLTAGAAGTSSFSAALYRKHREYNALLGALLLTAAMMAKLLWMHR